MRKAAQHNIFDTTFPEKPHEVEKLGSSVEPIRSVCVYANELVC